MLNSMLRNGYVCPSVLLDINTAVLFKTVSSVGQDDVCISRICTLQVAMFDGISSNLVETFHLQSLNKIFVQNN